MGKTNLFITIDTETFAQRGSIIPLDINVFGKVDGKTVGIPVIMDMCENYGFTATFFVDVLESYSLGKEALAEICQVIIKRGHDVQLHMHPNYYPGCGHGLMSEYCEEKQIELVSAGKALVYEMTGKMPVAFRAGKYGANLNTIKALKKNGFKIDSSYYYRHKNCLLAEELDNRFKNAGFVIDTVFEIPVSVYSLVKIPFYSKYSKVDINACSEYELNSVIAQLAGKVDLAVLFLHSFSFIKWSSKGRPIIDQNIMEKFETILKLIASLKDIQVINMGKFYNNLSAYLPQLGRNEFVPKVGLLSIINRIINR